MATSSTVNAGDLATAAQYNDLRTDVLSTHDHDGSDGNGTINPNKVTFQDQTGDPSVSGELQRNGANLMYHDGTSAIDLTAGGQQTNKTKASDESVTSSTTPQNDDDLLFSIAANEKWVVELHLQIEVEHGTNGGIKIDFSVPSGCTWEAIANAFKAMLMTDTPAVYASAGLASGFSIQTGASLEPTQLHIWAVINNGTNAGTVTLQWAQFNSHATAVKVGSNSWMSARKV